MLDVRQFKESRGITSKEMVEVAREQFPKYDKYLHSKVERPNDYGIRPVLALESAWESAFASTVPQCRKKDNRRLKARIQCRMTNTELERLQHALSADGYDTIQAGLTAIIKKYLEDRKDV